MRIKAMASALLATVLLVGCSGIDPVEQERRAVYEQQKKRDQAERAQRESDAASRRMDRVINQ